MMLTRLTSHNLPESRKKFLQLHYECKKIRAYDENDLKLLSKFMLSLCKLIGVTEAPDNKTIILLIDHLQEYHQDFSREELRNAFGLAMAGKLYFDFKVFNKLTPQLISITLNSYKVLRSKECMAYEDKLRKEDREEQRKLDVPNPIESLKGDLNRAIEFFESYRWEQKKPNPSKKIVKDWGSIVYNFLDKINLIDYSNEEKRLMMDEASKELILEKKKEKAKSDEDEFKRVVRIQDLDRAIEEIKGGKSVSVIALAKQIALYRYFDTLIIEDTNFKELLKETLIKGDDTSKLVAEKYFNSEK